MKRKVMGRIITTLNSRVIIGTTVKAYNLTQATF
jgi:hypothetical protein